MYRLGHLIEGSWCEHSHPPVFERRIKGGNITRLEVGVPASDVNVLRTLARCTEPPYYLLYVLVVPRGEAKAGRYQSPLLHDQQMDTFLTRFAAFFRSDGRCNLWVHSPSSNATLVWDRHNLIYAYGPAGRFEERLVPMGFRPGALKIPAPHEHYYRQECDADATAIMSHVDWRYSELQPGDDD